MSKTVKMKAWLCKPKDDYYSTVIFAETRGKARYLAQHTDNCEDLDFIDIEVKRLPNADCLYRAGKVEIDWYNENDRFILIKDCNFQCENVDSEDYCRSCPANNDCIAYSEYIDSKLCKN